MDYELLKILLLKSNLSVDSAISIIDKIRVIPNEHYALLNYDGINYYADYPEKITFIEKKSNFPINYHKSVILDKSFTKLDNDDDNTLNYHIYENCNFYLKNPEEYCLIGYYKKNMRDNNAIMKIIDNEYVTVRQIGNKKFSYNT